MFLRGSVRLEKWLKCPEEAEKLLKSNLLKDGRADNLFLKKTRWTEKKVLREKFYDEK